MSFGINFHNDCAAGYSLDKDLYYIYLVSFGNPRETLPASYE